MSIFSLNEKELVAQLGNELNKQMLEAAEPILHEAMKKVEFEMRKKMASMLIGFIENNFVVDRMGTDLRILIKQAKEK